MYKGDCYEANLKKYLDSVNKNTVLVHAMREIVTEYWGGHAFLLDKKRNRVFDFSNGKSQQWNKDEIFEKWNIQVQGRDMYFEYTKEQALQKVLEHKTFGSWDLTFENWNDENYLEYIRDYFIPKFQPVYFSMIREEVRS